MVTGGEATDEHLTDICPTTHVTRQMPPTFVWGVSDDKTAPVAQVYPFAQRMAEEGVACEMHVFDQVATAFRSATPIPRSTTRTSRFPSVPGSAWPSAFWSAICKRTDIPSITCGEIAPI